MSAAQAGQVRSQHSPKRTARKKQPRPSVWQYPEPKRICPQEVLQTVDDSPTFLEISIPTADVRRSLDWYRSIGFAELITGDIRPYHYAVVSDGSVCIGLHGDHIGAFSLSFVWPGVADRARNMQAAGRKLVFASLGIDDFHEAGLTDPAGLIAIMTEARTFSPAPLEEDSRPEVGEFVNLDLPSPDLGASIGFWQDFGFLCVESPESSTAELHIPGLRVELRTGRAAPALNYRTHYLSKLAECFEREQIGAQHAHDGLLVTAPEGTQLLFRDETN